MSHYILLQKDEPGAPLGFLPIIIQDQFYENAKNSNYGHQPWYSGSGVKHLPSAPCIITELEDMQFDIRSGSDFFYVVSDRLVELCLRTGVEFLDMKPATVLTTAGSELNMKYWLCCLTYYSIEDVVDVDKTRFQKRDSLIYPESIEIRADFSAPLFKIKDLSSPVDFIFCSEILKGKIEEHGIIGAYFEKTTNYEWSKRSDPMADYLLIAQGKLKPTLPV